MKVRVDHLKQITQIIICVFLIAAPLHSQKTANAHDILIEQTPQSGEILTISPQKIELTFNNNLLNIGTAVAVRDKNNNEYTTSEPQIIGKTLTQNLKPEIPSGEYIVNWRVVSSDSHPINGSYKFTLHSDSDIPTQNTEDNKNTENLNSEYAENNTNNTSPISNFSYYNLILTGTTLIIVTTICAILIIRKKAAKKS